MRFRKRSHSFRKKGFMRKLGFKLRRGKRKKTYHLSRGGVRF